MYMLQLEAMAHAVHFKCEIIKKIFSSAHERYESKLFCLNGIIFSTQISDERTPMPIIVLRMSSVKTTDLVQTKPSAVLYQTLSHKLLAVQRIYGLASETM